MITITLKSTSNGDGIAVAIISSKATCFPVGILPLAENYSQEPIAPCSADTAIITAPDSEWATITEGLRGICRSVIDVTGF